MDFNHFKNSNTALRDDQMKDIKGGSGTCGFLTSTGTPGCGYSKAEALFMVQDGGHWCCDSCATSSYCGGGRSDTFSGSFN
jgi:hypothetical protein